MLLDRSLPFSIFVMAITVPHANLFHREQRKSLDHGMGRLRRVRWSNPAGKGEGHHDLERTEC
jgi:hypothetical protein